MTDKTLRIAIDSSQAKSGAREVSAALKQVQRDAAAAVGKGKGIPIKLDASGMAEASRQVNNALRDIAAKIKNEKIQLGIDGSKVEAETAGIIRRIRSEIGRNMAQGISVQASLDVVTAAAEAEIDRVMDKARRGMEINVDADTTKAEQKIGRMRDEKGRFVPLKVEADTAKAQENIGRLRDEMGRFIGGSGSNRIKINVDAKDAADAMKSIGDGADKATKSTDRTSFSLRQAIANLLNFQKGAKDAGRSLNDMGDAAGASIGRITAAIGAITGFAMAAKSVVGANVEAQKLNASLVTVTGTVAKADAAFDKIKDFAKTTPYSLSQVTEAFIKLKSLGLDATTESLTSYGNTASAMGKPITQFIEAVADAASGEFERLKEFGVKASQQGDKVKFTFQGVSTTVQNDSRAIQTYLRSIGDVQFAGGMARQAETLGGKFSNLEDQIAEVSRQIGDGGLNKGLLEITDAMTQAGEKSETLSTMLGKLAGGVLSLLSNNLRRATSELNFMADGAKKIYDLATNTGPMQGPPEDPLSLQLRQEGLDATDLNGMGFVQEREKITPYESSGVFMAQNSDGKTMTNPVDLSFQRADDRDQERVAKAKSQAETFARENANNKEMVRTLKIVDDSYMRGRGSVEQYRNAIEDLTTKQSLSESVGKKGAQVLAAQAAQIRGFQESIAFKNEILNQQEGIDQTNELADAYGRGSKSVQEAEARINAYNTAVQLGMSGSKDIVDQLYKLADAAASANAKLSMSKDAAGMDEQINQIKLMTGAINEGKSAEQDASVFAEARAMAVKGGYENDIVAVRAIEDKIKALRDEKSHQDLLKNVADRDDELQGTIDLTNAYKEGGDAVRQTAAAVEARNIAAAAGRVGDQEWIDILQGQIVLQNQVNDGLRVQQNLRQGGFDLEQGYAEIETLDLTGEAYYTANERLDMLMQKKRDTGDAAAELTADEEALAAALGKLGYQTVIANDNLSQLGRQTQTTQQQFRDMTAQGLGHFEDALVDIITGSKSAREAFADMAKSIAADLARLAIRMAIIKPLAMMFGGGFGGGGGVSVGGGIYHTGGIVGADTVPIRPMSTWPKFHTGGLAQNETPAILQKGEGVFTKNQMAALAPVNNNSSSAPVTINVSVNQSQNGDPAAARDQGNIIAKHVEIAMSEFLVKAQKNGGILNPNGGYS